MKVLRALTADDLAEARRMLLCPEPGSRAAAAAEFGIDMTLVLAQLERSPAQRAAWAGAK